MGRLSLVHRHQRRLRLTHRMPSRQPLLTRLSQQPNLVQSLGLSPLVGAQSLAPTTSRLSARRGGDEGRGLLWPHWAGEVTLNPQPNLPMTTETNVAVPPSPLESTANSAESSAIPTTSASQPAHTGASQEQPASLQQPHATTEHPQSPQTTTSRRLRTQIVEQPSLQSHTPLAPLSQAPAPFSKQAAEPIALIEQPSLSQPATPAADLFASRNTDRSPQAWLARLQASARVQTLAIPDRTTPPARDTTTPATPITLATSAVRAPLIAPAQSGHVDLDSSSSHVPFLPPLTMQSGQPTAASNPQAAPLIDHQPHSTIQPPVIAAPTPLSQKARRFLKPLLGIDPSSVRIHRDSLAEQLTSAYQADAITIGEDIALATGHPDDTPSTLGLLAHELTHVARLRQPRFVPPVVDPTFSYAENPLSPIDERHFATNAGANEANSLQPASTTSEEAIAQRVEKRVTRAAHMAEQSALVTTSSAVNPPQPHLAPAHTQQREQWGGLPAPWEPLPGWLMSSPAEGSPVPTVSQPSLPTARETTGMHNGAQAETMAIQRAGQERSLDNEEPQAPAETRTQDNAHAPEADLDALARQVYALLKRRLDVERRRES